jgi:hypothetical protein
MRLIRSLLLIALSGTVSPMARADTPPLWGVDAGTVTAIAANRDAIFIGGAFRSVGPSTGGGVPVDAVTGAPAPNFPRVTGYAWVSISDGEGGWYIGGNFRAVGGKPHANLAHILSDGSVDDWNADTNDFVLSLLLQGHTLYVGGAFTTIAGKSRHAVAAFRLPSGSIEDWHPDPNGPVTAMVMHDQRLYFGGVFTTFDGQPRNDLAAVDLRGSARRESAPQHFAAASRTNIPALTSWSPSVEYNEDPPAFVWALASDEKNIFIGGTFSTVSGQPRSCLAAVDPDSGTVRPWAPRVQLTTNPYYYVPLVRAMALDKNHLYIGGHFSSVDGGERNGLASVDTRTGAVEAWKPELVDVLPYAEVDAIGVSDGVVYVGGSFYSVNGVTRENAVSFDETKGTLTEWRPRPNNGIYALGMGHSSIYVGGPFTSIWNWEPRRSLAALDRHTGKLLPWNPGITGFIVNGLALHDSTLYIGGAFWEVGGKPRTGIAAVSATTGAVTDWNPGSNGGAQTFLVSGSTLYVGGQFSQFGGQPRRNVAAVDLDSGALLDWKPEADDVVSALIQNGGNILMGGWFRRIGGQPRYGLAAVDTTAGALTPWNPAANDVVEALSLHDNKLYVGGGFTTLGSLPRAGVGAIDVTTGIVTDWNPNPSSYGPTVHALASSEATVFIGGDYRSIGGTSKGFLAAVDAVTGSVNTSFPDADNVVWSLVADGGDLFAGGSFNAVGGVPHAGLVGLPISARTVPMLALASQPFEAFEISSSPNPVRSAATLHYTLPMRTPVTLEIYDVQGRAVARLADRDIQEAGAHDVAFDTRGWRSGHYFLRFAALGRTLTRKITVLR